MPITKIKNPRNAGRKKTGVVPGRPYLQPEDWEYIERIGGGNRSRGLRQIIAEHRGRK